MRHWSIPARLGVEPRGAASQVVALLALRPLTARAFHVLFAADVEGDNVRVVTAYRPDGAEWQDDLKTRGPRR